MRRRLAACIGLVVVAAVTSAALRTAPSADGSAAKLSRWEITARVGNGSQILTRISNSSQPGHTGNGSIESTWRAQWRAKVRITGREVLIYGANGFNVKGTSSGEYRGTYPKTGGTSGNYTCPFGPITPAQVLTQLRLQGQGRTDGKVHLSIGVNAEPGTLPPVTCTGDAVEREVAKTLSAGVLTGTESACFGDPTIAGTRLKARKKFTIKKKFGWDPPSPQGRARPCNGFGDPIWSSGFGTLRLTFDPVN